MRTVTQSSRHEINGVEGHPEVVAWRPIAVGALQPEDAVNASFWIWDLTIEELIEKTVVKCATNLINISARRLAPAHHAVV